MGSGQPRHEVCRHPGVGGQSDGRAIIRVAKFEFCLLWVFWSGVGVGFPAEETHEGDNRLTLPGYKLSVCGDPKRGRQQGGLHTRTLPTKLPPTPSSVVFKL